MPSLLNLFRKCKTSLRYKLLLWRWGTKICPVCGDRLYDSLIDFSHSAFSDCRFSLMLPFVSWDRIQGDTAIRYGVGDVSIGLSIYPIDDTWKLGDIVGSNAYDTWQLNDPKQLKRLFESFALFL